MENFRKSILFSSIIPKRPDKEKQGSLTETHISTYKNLTNSGSSSSYPTSKNVLSQLKESHSPKRTYSGSKWNIRYKEL
jgi:hypothetical protein